ncbi:MAG: citryl-CoA lyase, partial [Methanothermobacter wolfeii]|nr:citryl-CoA lyase [Methanothermobacter wolfeii]
AGLFMIGRLPGLISHVYEEKVREPAFRKFFDIEEIHYDGEEERIIGSSEKTLYGVEKCRTHTRKPGKE